MTLTIQIKLYISHLFIHSTLTECLLCAWKLAKCWQLSREQGENGHSSHGAHILFGKRDMEQVLTCYKEDAIKDMG